MRRDIENEPCYKPPVFDFFEREQIIAHAIEDLSIHYEKNGVPDSINCVLCDVVGSRLESEDDEILDYIREDGLENAATYKRYFWE